MMSSRCFKKAKIFGLYGNWKRVDDFTKKKKKKKDSIEAIVRSNYSSDAHSRGVPNMIEVEKYTPLNLNIGRTVKDEHLFTREKKREYLIETVANELDVDRVDLIEKIERMRRLIPEIDTYAMTKEKMIEMYRVGSNMRACAKNAIGLKNVVFHESEVSVSEMIARDLRLVYDDDDDDDESGTVEKAETVVKVLMEQDLMNRKDAEKFVYATHRFCANKDRMLVFCEESFVRECVVQNVERLMQVLPNLKAWKIAEKGDAMLRMFFESDANENAVVAANELKKRMPKDCNISLMCSDFPNLLQMDIDRLFFDLSNAFKNQSAEETLRRDPSVSFRFENNSAKSQALGPAANFMQGEEENFGLMKTLPKARRDFLASAIVATFLVVNGGSSEFAYAYDDDYERDTLALLEETNLYIAAKINYDDISKTYAKWSLNYSIPGAVDAKRFGKSFLLTTKIISLLKGGVNFEQKASDWVTVAIALTDGSLNGKEAREAYGNLVWANNDRSDPKNRIGLCAFGTTSGTDFFGIDCEGF